MDSLINHLETQRRRLRMAWYAQPVRNVDRLTNILFIAACVSLVVYCVLQYFEPCATGSLCMAVVGMPGRQRRTGAQQLGNLLLTTGSMQHFDRPGLLERLCRRYVAWCDRRRERAAFAQVEAALKRANATLARINAMPPATIAVAAKLEQVL